MLLILKDLKNRLRFSLLLFPDVIGESSLSLRKQGTIDELIPVFTGNPGLSGQAV
jgi:hypothetical protein